jgi:hypothetical protein
MTTLIRTGASALYQPQQASAGERLAFLAAAAGATIALADCWTNRGSPPAAGYFVLMDRQASPAEAAAVEALLLSDPAGPKLPAQPKANGLVWLRLGDRIAPVAIAVVTAELDPADAPIVSEDAIVAKIPGQRLLGFSKGAPIAGAAGQGGDWMGLAVLSPPIAASGLQPPSAPGDGPAIGIDLSPARAGQLTFRGLVDTFGGRGKDQAAKDLVEVLVDPANPLNSTETYTGLNYALVEDGTGIHLRSVG